MRFLDLYYKSQLYVFTNLNLLILTPILSWYQEENLTGSDLIKNIKLAKPQLETQNEIKAAT